MTYHSLFNILLAALFLIGADAPAQAPEETPPSLSEVFSYESYARVLKQTVTNDARVDYALLKEDPKDLLNFVSSLESLTKGQYQSFRKKEKIAFWINAYNALTLKVIIENYPIKASFFRSVLYPKNSIRQIEGVWDMKSHTVLGENISLQEIEDKKLRASSAEPRIHFALVCASTGCPPLLQEPYRGETLDTQLTAQAKRYLASPHGLVVDHREKTISLSSIFKWFKGDFVTTDGTTVRRYLEPYVPETVLTAIRDKSYSIKYLDYDWSLNDRKKWSGVILKN